MKVFELLYLLNKELDLSIFNSPKTAKYISKAYNDIFKKIINAHSKNKTINKTDIEKLKITDYMKRKLQFLITQKIKPSETEQLKKTQLINKLIDFAGIGRSKAESLIKDGLKSITDLRKKQYKEQLSNMTKLLMKYKPKRKIPYDSIKKIEKKLTTFPNSRLVGSFRRKTPTSKDIDVMIVSNKKQILDSYITYLNNTFKKIHIYNKGPDKISLLVLAHTYPKNTYYKIDIFRCSVINQYAMLLYSTGSKDFNIKMRNIASKMGYLLNQNGLYNKKNNARIDIKSEKDIFYKLNMVYVEPYNR